MNSSFSFTASSP
uniref:Uncharacterized protein n=1 Tax=Anguilla anguilla TaxID=7936 RepID=A0A0E9U6F3_ANGAN